MTQPNDNRNDRTQRQQQSEPEVEALYSSICSAFSALPPNLEYLILWVDWEPIYSGFFPDYETMLEWLFAHQLPEERLDKAFPENGRFVEWLIANELIAFSNLLSEEEPQRLLRKRTPRNPGKNHWISSRDREFGSWWAAFTDRRMLDRQRQLEFYLKFLEAGERERVLAVKQTSVQNPFPYRESMDISYSQHLKQTVHHHGEHFLNGLYGNIWDTRIASLLCYYDLDGCLTESEVENIGGLLGKLRPQDLEYGDRWEGFHHNRPIEIYYNWYDPGYDGDEPVFVLKIQLPTDIWYPEVEGFLDKNIINWTGVYPSEDWMDNLELARCHTPRLNRFLAEFKQLTLEFGGEWGDPDYPNDRRKDGIPLP